MLDSLRGALGGVQSDEDVETAGSGDEYDRGRSFSLDSPKGYAAAGCCCCSFLVFLIMLLCSFAGLEATKYALLKNKVTGVVGFGTTYHGGRNLIGFWNDYLLFPANIQSIEWIPGRPTDSRIRDLSVMNVRTSDGLMTELGIVAQYQVVLEQIPDIYQTYKTDYESFFISNLRSAIQGLIAQFKATELYTDRPTVDAALFKTCQDVCADNLKGFLTCWGIQLLDINLDERIETANIRQQVEMQKQATAYMNQQASLLRAKTKVMEADFDRQIKIVKVQADAQATNITKKAVSDADFNLQEAKATALHTIQNTVRNGASPISNTDILKYLEQGALIDSTDGALVYGDFQSATVFANSGGSGSGRQLHEL